MPRSDLVDESFSLGALRDFMGRADAIVVSLPLAEDTRGIVGAAELAAMRPGAVIVNVGRGPVIDQRHVPAQILREPRDRHRVMACAEYHERRRRIDPLHKDECRAIFVTHAHK